MSSVFTRIIAGELPCYKIYEDEYTIAFLSISPYTHGHTLVVPKLEIDNIVDLPEPHHTALFDTAKKIAPAIQAATDCLRVSYMIVGLEVAHVHLHLVPTNSIDDLQKESEHTETPEQMSAIQQKIIHHLDNSQSL